jgi:hypothetical protein
MMLDVKFVHPTQSPPPPPRAIPRNREIFQAKPIPICSLFWHCLTAQSPFSPRPIKALPLGVAQATKDEMLT